MNLNEFFNSKFAVALVWAIPAVILAAKVSTESAKEIVDLIIERYLNKAIPQKA